MLTRIVFHKTRIGPSRKLLHQLVSFLGANFIRMKLCTPPPCWSERICQMKVVHWNITMSVCYYCYEMVTLLLACFIGPSKTTVVSCPTAIPSRWGVSLRFWIWCPCPVIFLLNLIISLLWLLICFVFCLCVHLVWTLPGGF